MAARKGYSMDPMPVGAAMAAASIYLLQEGRVALSIRRTTSYRSRSSAAAIALLSGTRNRKNVEPSGSSSSCHRPRRTLQMQDNKMTPIPFSTATIY